MNTTESTFWSGFVLLALGAGAITLSKRFGALPVLAGAYLVTAPARRRNRIRYGR